MSLFTDFPRALIVAGDAEQLEHEVVALGRVLEHEGVNVRTPLMVYWSWLHVTSGSMRVYGDWQVGL